MSNGNFKLFSPLQLGALQLKHRVVLAPLTRVRSPEHIPTETVAEYYKQRASDGGLLITEATHISVMGGNFTNVPGIFTPEHVRAWKKVTDAVHSKGGFIVAQLWHIGRASHPDLLGGRTPVAPSAKRMVNGKVFFTPKGPLDTVTPRELTIEEIKDTVSDYVHAAKLSIDAGFDGVEIHGANGYLIDQFICDNINTRTDQYGGSVENRARFPLEVADAVAAAIGPERTGIRISPFNFLQDTGTSDIIGHYGYVISELDKRGLAYVHLIEPRNNIFGTDEAQIQNLKEIAKARGIPEDEILSVKVFRKILKNTPLISAGSFNDKNAFAPVDDGEIDAVAFGRYFISNPDLPERLRKGLPLAPYDRSTFYGTPTPEGYIDYPTYEEQQAKL
ncbi:hypothetical protein RUND412_000235 [Rhizina undulata]